MKGKGFLSKSLCRVTPRYSWISFRRSRIWVLVPEVGGTKLDGALKQVTPKHFRVSTNSLVLCSSRLCCLLFADRVNHCSSFPPSKARCA